MKKLKAVAGFVLVPLFLVGCDTNEPLTSDSRTVSLDVSVATIPRTFPVWDRYRDLNHDGKLDPGDRFEGLVCVTDQKFALEDQVGQVAAPWGFNAEITLIRAGTVVSESLLPPSAAQGFNNYPTAPDLTTEYPPDEPFPPEAPDCDFTTPFICVNPRRLASVNHQLLDCIDPGTVPPPANLAGGPLPAETTLQQGDTIIVRLSRNPVPLLAEWAAFPGLFRGILRVDGDIVVPPGTSSTMEVNGVLYFSWQVR